MNITVVTNDNIVTRISDDGIRTQVTDNLIIAKAGTIDWVAIEQVGKFGTVNRVVAKTAIDGHLQRRAKGIDKVVALFGVDRQRCSCINNKVVNDYIIITETGVQLSVIVTVQCLECDMIIAGGSENLQTVIEVAAGRLIEDITG